MTASNEKYTCVPPCRDPNWQVRFVLKPNEAKGKPLFAIGLNPSDADEKKLDPTVENVKRFAEKYKDGRHLVMFNLCPYRTPNPKELRKLFDESTLDIDALLHDNIKAIKQELDAFAAIETPTVLACWGGYDGATGCRQYFRKSLLLLFKEIKEIPAIKWVRIKTKRETLHPLHPANRTKRLRSGDDELVEWKPNDVKDYFAEVERIYKKNRR